MKIETVDDPFLHPTPFHRDTNESPAEPGAQKPSDPFSADALVDSAAEADKQGDATKPPYRLTVHPEFLNSGIKVRKALNSSYPDASIEEQILFGVIGNEMVLLNAVADSAAQLATQVNLSLGNHAVLQVMTKTLKDVVALQTSLGRRIEGGFAAVANLRAQRIFLKSHTRGTNEE